MNISSIAGQVSLPWLPVYSASKFALAALTSAQRTELKPDRVHVMGVFPGYVKTDFQAHAHGPRPPDRVLQSRRFAISAKECAEAIVDGMAQRNEWLSRRVQDGCLSGRTGYFLGLVESRLERI